MKELNSKKQEEVEKLVDKAYECSVAGESERSFDLLEKAWLIFPEPSEYPEAYNVAKYNFEDYMKEPNLEKSKLWLNRMIENNNNLHHSDEDCSFCVAKYHFENKNFESSHELFSEVVKEAGNRYFEDENPKYQDFYLNPEKFLN